MVPERRRCLGILTEAHGFVLAMLSDDWTEFVAPAGSGVALEACVRKGLVERRGRPVAPGWVVDEYRRTAAGTDALRAIAAVVSGE